MYWWSIKYSHVIQIERLVLTGTMKIVFFRTSWSPSISTTITQLQKNPSKELHVSAKIRKESNVFPWENHGRTGRCAVYASQVLLQALLLSKHNNSQWVYIIEQLVGGGKRLNCIWSSTYWLYMNSLIV